MQPRPLQALVRRQRSLRRTPIAPEVVAKIKDEVLHEEDLAAFDIHDRYAAVLAYTSLSVGKLDIPVHSDHVGAGKVEDVLDAEVLNIESDSWELLEEMAEPAFDGTLSLESAAFGYLTRVDKHPIIPPSRHEL